MKTILSLAIVFFIATEGLFVGQFVFAGISGYRWIELLLFIFVLKSFFLDLKTNTFLVYYLKFLFLLFLFLWLKSGYLIFFEHYLDTDIFKQMFRLCFFMIVPYLIYYIIQRNIIYLKLILLLEVLIFLVGFFQFPLTPFTDFAWEIKKVYFMANSGHEIGKLMDRIPGLYGFAIPFSYVLASGGILTTYLYKKTNNIIYLYTLYLILIIAAMTLTRSIVIALLVLIVYASFSKAERTRTRIDIIINYLLIIGISYIAVNLFIENMDTFSRISNVKGESAEGRIPLLITGIYALLLGPLGVTPETYELARKTMFLTFHNIDIFRYAAHNGLVNFALYYTVPGLFYLFYSLYKINKIFLNCLSKQMKLFFVMSSIAYLLQSFFHNDFIFVKDFNILILVALLAYEYKRVCIMEKYSIKIEEKDYVKKNIYAR